MDTEAVMIPLLWFLAGPLGMVLGIGLAEFVRWLQRKRKRGKM